MSRLNDYGVNLFYNKVEADRRQEMQRKATTEGKRRLHASLQKMAGALGMTKDDVDYYVDVAPYEQAIDRAQNIAQINGAISTFVDRFMNKYEDTSAPSDDS